MSSKNLFSVDIITKRYIEFYIIKEMELKNHKICSKTVMDTSDPNITFNKEGESNYYTNYKENIATSWKNDGSNFDELIKIANKIKMEGKIMNLIV